ncbi:MAG: zinc ribbon domain-containing protein [Brevefilum sp.]
MKLQKRISFFICIIILLGLTQQVGVAQIQPDIRLDTVVVHLLPEYTHPTVLVIYEIDLDEALPLPQELNFNIPAEAEVLAVINYSPENRPVELFYQEARFGEWKDLQFSSTSHRIRIEYVDPNLVRQHNNRTYDFQWLSPFPAGAFTINVRQPSGASGIISQPVVKRLEQAPEEQPVYAADLGEISAGELVRFSLSYSKAPGDSAYLALLVQPARPLTENALGRTPSPISVILWLLVASVIIIVLVLFYYLRFRMKEADKFTLIGQGVGITNPERQVLYCQECGMRTKPGDSYCSKCGTELRKPTAFAQPPGR